MNLRPRPAPEGVIVPDYALPDALCVPFSDFTIRETLETLAREAARHVGVILICRDPVAAQAFVARQEAPGHFGIVTGAFDTPWLRDHAPLAVRSQDGLRHIRPARFNSGRVFDAGLFGTVFPKAEQVTPVFVAGGNVVAGPEGLAVSTDAMLRENGLDSPDGLAETARLLGIRDWLILPGFDDDLSRHADCTLRFLSPSLAALCRRRDTAQAAEVSQRIVEALQGRGLEVLELDAAAGPSGFDSPLNWVQLGDVLLMPDFGDGQTARRMARLEERGFSCVPIPCGTAGLGGGLHCLTASVFAG
ncbi:agmatine deiminase family protein [Tropicibacter sp. S64]|uniref:agmatine deiminase family protein n=1 Tax=Tropicibacter sp. S64 TaxID=3415122 RepID=UPI003C7AC77E